MSAILFSVNGMDNIFRDLNKLSENIKIEVAAEMNASALNILTTAKKNCTVDNSTLRTSIQLIEQQTKEKLIYTVGSKLKYAPYVEFGTGGMVSIPEGYEDFAIQFKGKDIRKINLRARPYLIPAYEKEIPNLKKNIQNVIANAKS